MTSLTADVVKAYKDFIRHTGMAPNRMLMNEETSDSLKSEILWGYLYEAPHPLSNEKLIFYGMRLVIDPWANGIEVALAR